MKLFSTPKRQFGWFLAFNALLWTLVPSLFYRVLPLDTAEAVSWGSVFTWGNSKHPPLPGWLAYGFSTLFDHADFSLFLLSQICVLLGLIYLYRLAREFMGEKDAIASALLVTFYYYYNWESIKFNVNLPQVVFLPMMAFYFARGVHRNSLAAWVLCGIAATGAFLSKYVAVLFFAALFVYMLCDKEARRCFLKPGPYIAVLIFLALTLPHILWLFDNDFAPLGYFQKRESGYSKGYLRNLLETVGVTAAPLLAAFFADAVVRFFGGGISFARTFSCEKKSFLCGASLELVPNLVILILALGGAVIHNRWNFQFFLFTGLLITSLRPPMNDKSFRWLLRCAVLFSLVLGLIMTGYLLFKSKERHHLEQAELGKFAETFYRKKTGRELKVIAGEMYYAAEIQRAHRYKIKVFLHSDTTALAKMKPEIAKSALFVGRNPAKLQNYADFGGATLTCEPVPQDFVYKAPLGKPKTLRLWFAPAAAIKPSASPAGEAHEKI